MRYNENRQTYIGQHKQTKNREVIKKKGQVKASEIQWVAETNIHTQKSHKN